MKLSYSTLLPCGISEDYPSSLASKVKEIIGTISSKWESFCQPSEAYCDNVETSTECQGDSKNYTVTAVVKDLRYFKNSQLYF